MRIIDLLPGKDWFFSFEFYPPKKASSLPAFFEVCRKLKDLDPLFVSVTYGAGGGNQEGCLEIVEYLKRTLDFATMAHLTCVGATADSLHEFLDQIKNTGVDNVLALRGDPPDSMTDFKPEDQAFAHASDLTAFIARHYPQMGIAVAAYPEGHPEASSKEVDLRFLKLKIDTGADLAVTQLFFDTEIYFDFVRRAREIGISAPIIPGVLPVRSLEGLKRMLCICKSYVPPDLMQEFEAADKAGGLESVAEIGVEHAKKMVRELKAGGAPGVHLYTLNKAEACTEIVHST